MEKFNKDILWHYEYNVNTLQLALDVTTKIGKLNIQIKDIFNNELAPSRIFAFIESRYSSKIEGVYTTLFDVVNTGFVSKQQKQIKPLVDALFRDKNIDKKFILEMANNMNNELSQSSRWDEKFGIYQTSQNDEKIKIYEPPLDKEEVDVLLDEVLDKTKKNTNIIQDIHCHILFEKIHPFVDGNGRIGRMILLKNIINNTTNFAKVLPLSWSIFSRQDLYYDMFDIKGNSDIDKGIQNMLNIILHMYGVTKNFLIELKQYFEKNVEMIKSYSKRITDEIAGDILLTLQTKSIYLQEKYNLNTRTVDKIFDYLNNNDLSFNRKIVNRKLLYWNIELELIIDKYFN